MKTKTKTNTTKKVTKAGKTLKINYQEMYNSQKVLLKNLQDELKYEQEIRVHRGEIIDDLNDMIDKKSDLIKILRFERFTYSFLSFCIGILFVYIFQSL